MTRWLVTMLWVMVALGLRAAGEKPSILFIGKPQIYLEVEYLDELEAHGFQVDAAAWETVTPQTLRRYHAIVITGYSDEGSNVEAGPRNGFNELRQRFVTEYMNAGGGVLVYLNTIGCYGKGKLGGVPAWLARFGISYYAEAVTDKSRQAFIDTPSVRPYSVKAAWTDTLADHPITAGAKSVWYPTGWGGHAAAQSVPVVASHLWTPIVRTGPDAELVVRDDVWADLWRAERPSGQQTLLAVCPVGQGRLGVIGMNPMWTAWSPYHFSLGSIVMKQGMQDRPSDWWKILENTYRWLSAPALQMGTYGPEAAKRPPVPGDTPAVDWAQLPLPPAPHGWYRGTVGAHTALTSGKGSVADWADAATKAGLSFVIFTEDLAGLDADKWEQLKQQCQGATTADFIAYPGIEYRNAAGTHGFSLLGYVDWLPADWLTDDGKRLNCDRGWSPAKGWGATQHKSGQIMMFLTYWKNGYFDYADNPSPVWDYKLYDLMPIWSARGGKVFESNLKKYLAACAAHVNPAAYALDLTYDPAELATILPQGRPHLVIASDADPRAPEDPSLQNLFNRFVVNDCAYKLGTGSYRGWQGPAATTGPALRLSFRGGYRWEGVEFPRYWVERYAGIQPEDWYMPSWYRLPVRIDAASDAGIASVDLYDGERHVRHFDAKGAKAFAADFAVVQMPTRHLVAVVTDANGKQAVSREIWMEQQQTIYNYCGDRVNVPKSTYSPIHGHPYKGFTSKEEVRHFFVDLVSPDIAIESYTTDSVYQHDELTDTMGWHNWAPHHPRLDYTYTEHAYNWFSRHGRKVSYATHPSQQVYWDGFTYKTPPTGNELPPATLDRRDHRLQPIEPYKLDADGFLPPTVVTWTHQVTAEAPGTLTIVRPGSAPEVIDLLSLKDDRGGELPVDALVTFSPDNSARGESLRLTGPGAAWHVHADKTARTIKVGLRRDGAAVQGGMLFPWFTEQINRCLPAQQLSKPAWFTIEQGELAYLPLVELAVKASDGAAVIHLNAPASDYNCQPIVVSGLSDAATAGYYERETGRYRPIGVLANPLWGGTAYAQLPSAEAAGRTVVIGNLVTCDKPGLFIEMVQDTDASGRATGAWLVEVHNPTGQAVDATLTFPKAFAPLVKTRQQQVQVPAGASSRFSIQ